MPNPVAALFLPRRRLAAADPLVLQRGGPLGGTQWVAPRGECQYRQHDFNHLPSRQRAAAAALHVKRFMPSVDALARIGWQDGIAHFWIWEKPLPAAQKGRIRWMPESALRRPLIANGQHLLQCLVGVEGQVWEDGRLLASQWWPVVPAIETWQRFLRGASIALDRAPVMPAVQRLPLLPYPWPLMQAERSGRFADTELVIWVAALSLLGASAGWQAASLDAWHQLRDAQVGELDVLRSSSATILDGREVADAAAAELASLQKLQKGVSDYVLIADILAPLPPGSMVLTYLREGGKIRTLVKTPEKDLRKLTVLYQSHPLLREASALVAGESVELTFEMPKPVDEDTEAESSEDRAELLR